MFKKKLFENYIYHKSSISITNCQDSSESNTDEVKKTFDCTICGKKLLKKSNLNRHLRSHTGEKPYECLHFDFVTSMTCGKRFTRKDILVNHMRTHTGEKLYECIICGKRFSDKRNLNSHMGKCGEVC